VVVTATAQIDHSTLLGNEAIGGAGPTCGTGQGGGLANLNGGTLTVSNSLIALNRAIGGAGDGTGGNGRGGGVFNGGPSPVGAPSLTLDHSLVMHNSAEGGTAGPGGSAGLGQGGGLYLAPGGSVCLDAFTVAHLVGNSASTGDDDVFGTFTTCD
jgi:hypothetical protein